MDWINNFEREFNILATKNHNVKIIIGQQKYLQKIGDLALALEYSSNLNNYYREFPEVAFLVNRWIKIQDSLEMLFNLICGSSKRALKILSYLREKEICPYEFANYLASSRKLLLINRSRIETSLDAAGKKVHTPIKLTSETCRLVNQITTDSALPVDILFIGNNSFKLGIKGRGALKNRIGWVIHSSGANLNKDSHSERYFSTWYELDQGSVRHYDDIEEVLLENFCVL